ncbi:Beta N-acetyl-glucosaminidase [hydrothermal vent metagenome]|uniref:beta-N-acetylhexosaminidase n=1 Tax=hydrothermal vent metagenome TaxID=652676 RepID=A0A1W1CK74_9ZZZZ
MIAPIMIDVLGLELTHSDIKRIQNNAVGGVILFTRNYKSKTQVRKLIKDIRNIKDNLLIAVDHEGGRVQRFKGDGWTHIPAMAKLGELYDNNSNKAVEMAKTCGFVLAYELAEIDVDFSFTPVLDVDYGSSSVIGDRAFHKSPQVIAKLSQAFVDGVNQVGMKTVGKHFPGHGFVVADSHIAQPIDTREISELEKDFEVFSKVSIDAIMPAHIIFPKVDDKPACFSSVWLKNILRNQLKFKGCVFSDDLSMQGALFYKDINQRVDEALKNGCDMVLICNNEKMVDEVLNNKKEYQKNDNLLEMRLKNNKISVNLFDKERKKIKEFKNGI